MRRYPSFLRSGWVTRAVPPVTLALAAAAVLLFAGCGTEAPADWQWWTSADTAAVQVEVARWQGTLDLRPALTDTLRLNLSLPLTFADSSSPTGETLYKFKRLFAVWTDVDTTGHSDGYLFSRTNDTLPESDTLSALNDTFCQVSFCDTVTGTMLYFRYDSLWVVGYRPDTTVDTTRTPPETTIVFHASYTDARGFAEPQVLSRPYDWTARRLLHLDKTPDVAEYTLKRFTGSATLVPTAQDAPSITWATFARPGRIDTFFYTARQAPDLRGLYNERSVDSLYTIGQGEQVEVTFVTGGDSTADRERFYVTVNGTKTDVTVGPKRGAGTVSLADTGYQHIYVQAVSLSGISTTAGTYKTNCWAIPVRVTPRQ
jgi:hypothetical protein